MSGQFWTPHNLSTATRVVAYFSSGMAKEHVQEAIRVCDSAFQGYIREASKTHQLLTALPNPISSNLRLQISEQRMRENDALRLYRKTRTALLDVMMKPD